MSNTIDGMDPYQVAEDLHQVANDLVSDMTSLTVTDLAEILNKASDFVTRFADEHFSYVSKTKVTLTIGREVIDLTEEVLPMLNSSMLHSWIREAIMSYISSGLLPVNSDHGHGHTH